MKKRRAFLSQKKVIRNKRETQDKWNWGKWKATTDTTAKRSISMEGRSDFSELCSLEEQV